MQCSCFSPIKHRLWCNFSIFHLLIFPSKIFSSLKQWRQTSERRKMMRWNFGKSLNSKNHTINVYRQIMLTGASSRCYYNMKIFLRKIEMLFMRHGGIFGRRMEVKGNSEALKFPSFFWEVNGHFEFKNFNWSNFRKNLTEILNFNKIMIKFLKI